MPEPVAYVSTWRIRAGKFEDYKRFYAELVRIVDANLTGGSRSRSQPRPTGPHISATLAAHLELVAAPINKSEI